MIVVADPNTVLALQYTWGLDELPDGVEGPTHASWRDLPDLDRDKLVAVTASLAELESHMTSSFYERYDRSGVRVIISTTFDPKHVPDFGFTYATCEVFQDDLFKSPWHDLCVAA